MELFKLLGTIAIDNSDANKALDDTSNKGSQTQSKLSKAFGAVGKGAAVVGKTVVTGLAAGTTAFAGLTAKALSASGELEQNMGGSEAVFKDYAGKMQETAKTAFSQMGLSTSDYLATANKMGALFQGAGFSIKDSMDLSSGAMQRAADVASIMGIDTGAAMEAIAGAAKGNFTMMDNLGVAMNDTTLNAYAMSKGIDKTTQEMTNQEKIGLAMEMFMEKTAYAAGNYAKENETLAGSLGTAKSALTNFLDGSGSVEDLVSSFGNLANVAVNSLQEIIPRMTTGLTDTVNQIMPKIPPLLQKILPSIIQGATSLINGLTSALPGLLSVVTNDLLPSAISAIQSIFTALVTALPGLVQTLASALPTLIPLLVNSLVSMIVTLCTMLPQIIQPIIDNLPVILESLITALLSNLPVLVEGLISLVSAIIPMLPEIVNILLDSIIFTFTSNWASTILELIPVLLVGLGQLIVSICQALPSLLLGLVKIIFAPFLQLWTAIKTVFEPIAPWFNDNVIQPVISFFKNLWEGIKVVWDGICNVVSIAIQLIGSILSAAFQIITLPFRFIWENCKEYVFAAFEWIKEKISVAINFIKGLVQVGFGFVKEKIITPILEAKDKAVEAFNNIKSKIQEKITAVKNKVSEIFGNIKSKISDTVNNIKTTVTNVFNKVKEAMEKPIQKARDTIKGIVDKIKGFFSGLKLKFPNIKLPHFGISPSGWKIGDLLKGSIPKLSIDWYARAMNNPMIMTRPTIFGYDASTGQLMGGGEAGSEVVSGTNTLMNMIQAAVAAQNDTLTYYLQALIDMLAEYFPEALVAMREKAVFDPDTAARAMAVPMNRELGRLTTLKGRGR